MMYYGIMSSDGNLVLCCSQQIYTLRRWTRNNIPVMMSSLEEINNLSSSVKPLDLQSYRCKRVIYTNIESVRHKYIYVQIISIPTTAKQRANRTSQQVGRAYSLAVESFP